ncbi:hypothetical protein CPB97_002612 [Podila verticillata]|nr:hypothetical protein CPB97_002612 [Podila verticillata]
MNPHNSAWGPWNDTGKPRVIIAGAGIGGLTMAILLNKAGVTFEILERSDDVKQLGSAIALGPSTAPLLKQLGIYEEFKAISKPAAHVHVVTDNDEPVYNMDVSWLEEATGYRPYITSRPELYDLLWSQVPRECINLNKKIVSFDQDLRDIYVRCSDGTVYQGDILIGADGAHSAVRQHLYRSLKAEGKLPKSDDAPLPYSCVCLVGQTEALNPDEFPDLKEEFCKDYSVVGTEKKFSWCTFTTKQNTLCWMVIEFLDQEASKDDDSHDDSDWGPGAAEAMCSQVRDLKIPGGKDGKQLTIGDLIDRTPKDRISKVTLEEKLFETWSHGRAVLIGDACHKLVPSSGQGAATAMQDAVTLANWINSLDSWGVYDLNPVFKEYRNERYPIVKGEFETSQGFTSILGKDLRSVTTRAVLKWLPAWVWERIISSMAVIRPQAAFLPLIEDKPSLKPAHQPSLEKTLVILKKQAEEAQVERPRAIAVV